MIQYQQDMMSAFWQKHKSLWVQKGFALSVLFGSGLLLLSLSFNYLTGNYASRQASNAVTDIVLDNIPVVNVDFIFVEGFALFIVLLILLVLAEPKRLPFVLKSMALFVFVRAVAISLTHIGPFPQQAPIDEAHAIRWLTFTGDLFFSGHAGLPFLMTFVFWDQRYLRYIFLTISIVFASAVLLGHWHYSIDVFAAYFITHSVFMIGRRLFAKDYRLMTETATS